jgi:hypothetical protein
LPSPQRRSRANSGRFDARGDPTNTTPASTPAAPKKSRRHPEIPALKSPPRSGGKSLGQPDSGIYHKGTLVR